MGAVGLEPTTNGLKGSDGWFLLASLYLVSYGLERLHVTSNFGAVRRGSYRPVAPTVAPQPGHASIFLMA